MRKKITILMSMLFVLVTSQSFAQTNLDFEPAGAGAGYAWTVTENGTNPALAFIANPMMAGVNTSATVTQFVAEQGGNPWALCFTDDIGSFTFSAANAIVKIMVWKPTISNVGIKFEMPGGANHEIQIPNTVVNQWEELTFDFSSQIGVAFSRLVIIPDFIARTQTNTLYFDNLTFSSGGGSATSDITFQVDMNQYTGSTTNGVFLNGTFNGWCGSCNPMTDADGDGVWEVMLPIANGAIEYKFTVDGWNDQEQFAGGEPCTVTNGGFTNRSLIVAQATTLPTVCFNSCAACGGGMSADSVDVTFQVNAALVTTDAAGLFLAGGGTFGNPGDNPMSDADGDDVWTITVRLPKGMATDYTFTNGNCPSWGCKENIVGMSCAVGPFSDRNFSGAWADTTVLACFQACDSDGTCPVPATMINVTFQVDMSSETVDPAGVFLGGNFEGWSGGQVLDDADANDVWAITMQVASGSAIEWKFINGASWANPEEFDSTHFACAQDFGGFINRAATLGSSDTTLPAFFFNGCEVSTVSTKSVFTKDELFSIAPTLVTDATIINFNENIIAADKQIRVVNAVGQVVMNQNIGHVQQYRLDASNLTNGLYFVVIQSEGFAQTARILVSK
jgi:hypothetical protein